MKTFFRFAFVICIAHVSVGCAGTFEEARVAGIKENKKLGAAPVTRTKEEQEECDRLDDSATLWGASTKILIGLAGASGLASWPVKSPDAKDALIIGAGISGTAALGSGFIWDSKTKTWTRKCSQ
jgi:hypothetical protein